MTIIGFENETLDIMCAWNTPDDCPWPSDMDYYDAKRGPMDRDRDDEEELERERDDKESE